MVFSRGTSRGFRKEEAIKLVIKEGKLHYNPIIREQVER